MFEAKKSKLLVGLLFIGLTNLVPLEAAFSCSGSGEGGLTHGSQITNGSVTVCVGSSNSSPGSNSRTTTTTTTTTTEKTKPAKPKKKKANASKVISPAPSFKKSKPEICPSVKQLQAMPRSADAAENWVKSICNPKPKPIAKAKPKKKKPKKSTTTTVTVISTPATRSLANDSASFTPMPLRASYKPETVLAIGQNAEFTAFPSLHFRNQLVLGKIAEVEFTPQLVTWSFSDGEVFLGTAVTRGFGQVGKFTATAEVSYQVRYRIFGASNWKLVNGSIRVASPRLQITVASEAKPDPTATGTVLLVGAPCQGSSDVFGCNY